MTFVTAVALETIVKNSPVSKRILYLFPPALLDKIQAIFLSIVRKKYQPPVGGRISCGKFWEMLLWFYETGLVKGDIPGTVYSSPEWNAFSTKKRFSHLKKIHRIINFWRVFKCGSQIFKVLVEQNSWVEKWPHFGGKKALNISTILRSSGGKWKSTIWIHCRPRSTARVPLGLSWWIEKIHTVEKYGPNQTST